MMFIRVDLPLPELPMIATYSPGSTRRSTSRSACTAISPAPYTLETPSSTISGRPRRRSTRPPTYGTPTRTFPPPRPPSPPPSPRPVKPPVVVLVEAPERRVEPVDVTTVWPLRRPLTISVAVSPCRPATTRTRRCTPFLPTTATVAFAPLPVTALDGTLSTSSRSAVVTLTFAVIPGLSRRSCRSSATVTSYWTTLDEDVLISSTETTRAGSSTFVSAGTVTVAASPTAISAASLSAKAAVASMSETLTSVTRPDDELEPFPDEPLPAPLAPDADDAVDVLDADALPPPLTVSPTTPETEATVPVTGARSTVCASVLRASASATSACVTAASSCATAADVGGACLTALPATAALTPSFADETCCLAPATPCRSFASVACRCCSAVAIACRSFASVLARVCCATASACRSFATFVS